MPVYLPGDQSWFDMKTGAAYKGGATHKLEALEDSIPAFQRAGTIIPRKDRFRRSSTQMENDPYTLVCFRISSLILFWNFFRNELTHSEMQELSSSTLLARLISSTTFAVCET